MDRQQPTMDRQQGTMDHQQTTKDRQSQSANRQQQSADRMDKSDSDFVTKAAQGGMAEVKLGQLAASKGSSQEVKDFGQKMVTDHGKANDQLKEIASKKGMTLPTDIDASAQATYDRLSKLDGAAFDKAYIADMVKDHKTDVAEFKRESTRGMDSDLKSFASSTLPIIQGHLDMAQKMHTTGK